ncbi:ACP S-malonyltransferase [Candidatus Microgenomates bacterium]|nr:MAG: ACP S-malonyltransferase [Candidatus Microgenomates bacterium]
MSVEMLRNPEEGSRGHEREPLGAKIAYIFPGQGAQFKGMGKDLFENSKAARAVFREADDTLGFSLSSICFDDPNGDLVKTGIGQLALGTVAIASYEAALEKYPQLKKIKPVIGGGVSFGELPNLVAANVLSFRTYLKLIDNRGEIMEETGANPKGAMYAVMGLERERINAICQQTEIFPAIYYPGITVISGESENLKKAIEVFKGQRAKVRETGVEYPFHTPLMGRAAIKLAKYLGNVEFSDPEYPILFNSTGEILTSGKAIKESLPNQLTGPVDLEKGVEVMTKRGAQVFVEFCPRPILTSHMGKINPNLNAKSIFDFQSLQNAASLVG